jgi:hypothetical protein
VLAVVLAGEVDEKRLLVLLLLAVRVVVQGQYA